MKRHELVTFAGDVRWMDWMVLPEPRNIIDR